MAQDYSAEAAGAQKIVPLQTAMNKIDAYGQSEKALQGPLRTSQNMWESAGVAIDDVLATFPMVNNELLSSWQSPADSSLYRQAGEATTNSLQAARASIGGSGGTGATGQIGGSIPNTLFTLNDVITLVAAITQQAKTDLDEGVRQFSVASAKRMTAAAREALELQFVNLWRPQVVQAGQALNTLGQTYEMAGQSIVAAAQSMKWEGPGSGNTIPGGGPRGAATGPGIGAVGGAPGVNGGGADAIGADDAGADAGAGGTDAGGVGGADAGGAGGADQAGMDGAAAADAGMGGAGGGTGTGDLPGGMPGGVTGGENGTGLAGLPTLTAPPALPTVNLPTLPSGGLPNPNLPGGMPIGSMPIGGLPTRGMQLPGSTVGGARGLGADKLKLPGGLGNGGLGSGGLGSGGLGSGGLKTGDFTMPKPESGLPRASLTSTGEQQIARVGEQMSPQQPVSGGRPPTAPGATGLAGTGSPNAGAGGAPPMMPPGAMGGAGGGGRGGKPGAGTIRPTGRKRDRRDGDTPGVPVGLRGKAGKDLPGAFPSVPASTRRRQEKNQPADTLQLLDEDLWKVEESEAVAVPSTPRRLAN